MTKLSVAFCLCLNGVKSPIFIMYIYFIFFRPIYMGWLSAGTSQGLCHKKWWVFIFFPNTLCMTESMFDLLMLRQCNTSLVADMVSFHIFFQKQHSPDFFQVWSKRLAWRWKRGNFFKRSSVVHNLVSPRKFLWPRHNRLFMESIQLYLLQALQMEVTRQANCSQRPYIPPSGTSLLSHRIEMCTIFLLTQDYDRG